MDVEEPVGVEEPVRVGSEDVTTIKSDTHTELRDGVVSSYHSYSYQDMCTNIALHIVQI